MDLVPLISIALGLSLLMTMAWAVQRVTGSSGWIDAIWSIAVGLGGIAAAVWPDIGAVDERRIVVGLLVTIWAIRLGGHIAARTHGAHDDPRYAKLMQEWGKDGPRNLFLFLQIQAAAAFVLVLAVRLAAINPHASLAITDVIGVALLITAIVGEGVADAQLRRFGKTHKGAVCDTGLWAWSRHPNYFFEWLAWVAWAVIAFDPGNLWSLVAAAAPALMYYLLVYASGIPPLEAHMLASRGDRFRAYQRRVSPFFPLPPKTPAPQTTHQGDPS
ncbi:hypothetical protein ABI_16740 [Asticcacaulis biprosthecium C19]|uniref:Uncharacterized protein n=1 Tax=Asticcacaulis biprosthecium C19 TaxID=715226 RepID=F4QJX7_9CAUL|nr:DUF1295 domain-containing protein [Asticcacaulis biprosthecium]EGF93234.1 hypothetical protein ABI_16740 [Asticcacaulis biprosthecium C19]